MELSKGHMFRAVILLLLCFISSHYGAMAATTIGAKPQEILNTFKLKRLSLSILNNFEHPKKFDGNFEVKRLVPSGPNRQESPDTPSRYEILSGVPKGPDPIESPATPTHEVKRIVPSGPNPQESPDSPALQVDRLVPGGPNPQESPDAPPRPEHLKAITLLLLCLNISGHYGSMAHETTKPKPLKLKRLSLTILNSFELPKTKEVETKSGIFEVKRLVPSGSHAQELPDPPNLQVKRLVPSGPNAQESPDPPSFEVKRLVPSGPNAQESPDSPTKPDQDVESFVYFQSNSFEQSPPAI
ncbi:hypothetical protein ACH5RR_034446 [Cinchona calisaya]|uniref:Uncharacterized protein n=1 Tax=Cinchona calisaya TaxID=153742 RepID=A0ABD2YBM0_9GENT